MYKAGGLEVELLGVSNSAVASIQNTAKALSALSRAIDKVNNSQFVLAGQKLEHIFTKIASATKSIDTTNLTALASAGKSLSAISKIGNLEKVDFEKIGNGFNNLSVAITPFLEKVKSAEGSLTALYGTLSKASGKKIQGLLGGDSGTPKGKKGGAFSFLNIAKWTSIIYSARRLGRVVSGIVQAGADYTETLNLWETAMGNNLDVATEFVSKMNEAYGISEKTLMNAQAIFKNMLGSLGQISDQMAYSLSEGITQMAIDYASLYNVTFEKAFEKFQAALAGQVRPIRSVSGYDITENTLYQLYQSFGGTKSVRNLSRTEKQLLSILAVFNQMTASGAVGDLEKTMESYANQSRVMAESWQQVKTYAGVLLTYTIQESGIMVKLNAMLITVARYLEVVAKQLGAIQHFGGDLFESTTESAKDASNAVDELQGKLLDFDKFRSLRGIEENALGLDEKLLNALSGYNTILGNASNEARELSDQWLKAWGFTINANGELELTNEQLKSVKDKLNGILSFLGKFNGKETLELITPLMSELATTLKELLPAIATITSALSPIFVGIVKFSAELTKTLDTLGLLRAVIYTIIMYKLTTKVMSFAETIGRLHKNYLKPFFDNLGIHSRTTLPLAKQGITGLQKATLALSAAFLVGGISALLSSEMTAGEKLTKVFVGLAAGITAAAIAISAFKQNWVQALSIGATVAGGFFTVSALSYDNYANGGLPDKGTLFRAGEAGAEIVYNTPSGQSGVVNVQQIEQAMYSALVRYGRTQGENGQPIEVYLDGEKVYQNTTAHAKRRGNVWGKA